MSFPLGLPGSQRVSRELPTHGIPPFLASDGDARALPVRACLPALADRDVDVGEHEVGAFKLLEPDRIEGHLCDGLE